MNITGSALASWWHSRLPKDGSTKEMDDETVVKPLNTIPD